MKESRLSSIVRAVIFSFVCLLFNTFANADTVSGIINTNTVWDASGSPYIVNERVQIAQGVTLRVEPGVEIKPGLLDHFSTASIEVFGVLEVIGNEDSPVVVNGVNIASGPSNTAEGNEIIISHAHINSVRNSLFGSRNGRIYSGKGSLILRDSVFKDAARVSVFSPHAISYIERNVFINSEGIITGATPSLYIRNNYFYGQTTAAVRNNYGGVIAEKNSFVSTDRIAAYLGSGGTSAAITAHNNYWGTLDESIIEQMIKDKNDDLALPSYIPFIPYLNDHDPDTPLPPDDDGDDVPNVVDNCINVTNASQNDVDNDGAGDACDIPVELNGTVKTSDGMDICAMVLASGQYTFSCNPTGIFELSDLAVEAGGTIKLQVYADGFQPYIVNLIEPETQSIIMTRSGTCPSYNIPNDPGFFPNSAGKKIFIAGWVLAQDTQTPVCAMVLANGQYTFSCNESGGYGLWFPLDNNGQFKLQVYADGFAPTIQTFDEHTTAFNYVRMARATECQAP